MGRWAGRTLDISRLSKLLGARISGTVSRHIHHKLFVNFKNMNTDFDRFSLWYHLRLNPQQSCFVPLPFSLPLSRCLIMDLVPSVCFTCQPLQPSTWARAKLLEVNSVFLRLIIRRIDPKTRDALGLFSAFCYFQSLHFLLFNTAR